MGFFDNLIENFSAKDLKSRVTGVIVLGFIVCAIAGAGLYYLLLSQQEVTVSGIGRWAEGSDKVVAVSLEQDDLRLLGERDEVRARFLDPRNGSIVLPTRVIALNPASPSVDLDGSALPKAFSALEKFDVDIILIDLPMWKMLWGPR